MDNRHARRLQAAEAIKALEAARAKRMQRVVDAARERKEAPDVSVRFAERADVKLAGAVMGADGRAVYGWVRNISATGCYAAVSETLPVGAACTVRLNLPAEAGSGHLDLPATVARVDEAGMGLAFTYVVAEARRVLDRLVADFDVTLG